MKNTNLWLIIAFFHTALSGFCGAAPLPAPPKAISIIPIALSDAVNKRDTSGFLSYFTSDCSLSVDGVLIAHGKRELSVWLESQFRKGWGMSAKAATVGMGEIWTIDETAFENGGPHDECCGHGRVAHYVLKNGIIASAEIFDDKNSIVYVPPFTEAH